MSTVSEIQPWKGPKLLYLATLFGLTPRRRGSSGTISTKFLSKGHRWPRHQMVQKHCGKFQSPEQGARTLQTTDDRQTDDRQTTTYSEREREFTVAKNSSSVSKFCTLDSVLSINNRAMTSRKKSKEPAFLSSSDTIKSSQKSSKHLTMCPDSRTTLLSKRRSKKFSDIAVQETSSAITDLAATP